MSQTPEYIGYGTRNTVIVVDRVRNIVWLTNDGQDEFWDPYSFAGDDKMKVSEEIVRSLAENGFAAERIIRLGNIWTTVTHAGDQPNKKVGVTDYQTFLVLADTLNDKEFTAATGVNWEPFTLTEIENSSSAEIRVGEDNIAAIKEWLKN